MKMRTNYSAYLIVSSGLLGLFISCSDLGKTDALELDTGYDYYPLGIGRSWIYEVDSIIFRPGPRNIIKDTTRSYLHEVIVDTAMGLDGEQQYLIQRYYRKGPGHPWQIAKVFTRSRSERQAFQTEDNLRFIKMPFPPTRGKRWDGHLYFDERRLFPVAGEYLSIFENWDYRILETEEQMEVGGRLYKDILTIQQANSTDIFTNYRLAKEYYARDIGMIYREWSVVDTQCRYCCGGNTGQVCQSLPWQDRAEKGFYLRQTLISYD